MCFRCVSRALRGHERVLAPSGLDLQTIVGSGKGCVTVGGLGGGKEGPGKEGHTEGSHMGLCVKDQLV